MNNRCVICLHLDRVTLTRWFASSADERPHESRKTLTAAIMFFYFAATLEYNDRKVDIIKLLKVEKEQFLSTAAQQHITVRVYEETLASKFWCDTKFCHPVDACSPSPSGEGSLWQNLNLLTKQSFCLHQKQFLVQNGIVRPISEPASQLAVRFNATCRAAVQVGTE